MSLDIIKSYLVSIGFNVDKKSFDSANSHFNSMDKAVNQLAANLSKSHSFQKFADNMKQTFGAIAKFFADLSKTTLGSIAIIGGAVISLSAIIAAAVAKFMSSMAEADLKTQKFAISLFTTVRNARSLQATMSAMGLKSLDDLKYINLIPEQRQQFLSLRKLAASLEPGENAKEGFQNIRKVGYALQRLQVTFGYFLMNIAGTLGKILEGPLNLLVHLIDGMSKALMAISNVTSRLPWFFRLISDLFLFMVRALGKVGGDAMKLPGYLMKHGLKATAEKVGSKLGHYGQSATKDAMIIGGATADSFKRSLGMVFGYEGGYKPYTASTGDPETKYGITKPTYDAWHRNHPDSPASVKDITRDIAASIYKTNYWDPLGSALSAPLKAAAFNFGITSGVGTSKRLLAQSGGDLTRLFQLQRQYYRDVARRHPEKARYLPGWLNRENSLESRLHTMYDAQAPSEKKVEGRIASAGAGPMNITINIHGAGDPTAVANAVSNRLQNMLNIRSTQGTYA